MITDSDVCQEAESQFIRDIETHKRIANQILELIKEYDQTLDKSFIESIVVYRDNDEVIVGINTCLKHKREWRVLDEEPPIKTRHLLNYRERPILR